MRLMVNPLVLAAALGLIGPAALAEDEERDDEGDRLAGVWQRTSGGDRSPLALGDRIEVIPFDGTVILDDGAAGPNGAWTLDDAGGASQQLVLDGLQVVRHFSAQGDTMAVRTTVEGSGGPTSWSDTFERMG